MSDPEMVRSFLALEISEAARDWIEERGREMKRDMKGNIRWVKRDALHITLHFFGKIPRQAIEKVGEILGPLTREYPPFLLRMKGIGAFPNLRNPRVLWAGVEDMTETRKLKDFHEAMRASLAKAGFAVEKRPFTPHVTIGRVKKFTKFSGKNFHDLPECPLFSVADLTFFQSDLTPKGPIYQPLNRFSFGGERNDRTD